MKPVIEEVIDKNQNTITRFNPLGTMILFAAAKARNPDMSDLEIFNELGTKTNLHKQWVKRYGEHYQNWLEEFVDGQTYRKSELLEIVGMSQAIQPGNYQYWRDMAKTHGVIRDEPKTSTTINVNTDFSQVHNGTESFEDARRRLLSELRGVDYKGGSRVVDAVGIPIPTGREGEGDRACRMQEEPLAMANPLGEDRGCSEQGVPIPAIPERPTPTSDDPLLGKRTKPTRAKK